jgi:hypothetical protein
MNSIHVIKYIELRYADPICSLSLNLNSVTFGTMLGRSCYYNIPNDKYSILSEGYDENITGSFYSLDEPSQFFLSIGDFAVKIYKTKEDGSTELLNNINNYETEGEHSHNCDNCYTILYDKFLLRIFLILPSNEKVEINSCEYIVKNIINNESDSGKIEMSNYSVPFDYNGRNYVWIDFKEKEERILNIFNFEEKKIVFTQKIEKDFGHISHLRYLDNGKFFLVRNYNICEIRDENWKLEKDFVHIGNEVLACDFYFENNENGNDENNEKNNENDLFIATLDIDAQINVYNYKEDKIEKEFNLFELDDIRQEEKDQQFFSMGYPYYIRFNKDYFTISTDYGCYIIKRK